jgi:hypothetical protein
MPSDDRNDEAFLLIHCGRSKMVIEMTRPTSDSLKFLMNIIVSLMPGASRDIARHIAFSTWMILTLLIIYIIGYELF